MLVLHLFGLPKMAGSRYTLYIKCGMPPTPSLSCMTGSLYNSMYRRLYLMLKVSSTLQSFLSSLAQILTQARPEHGSPADQQSVGFNLMDFEDEFGMAQGNTKLSYHPFWPRVCNFFSRLHLHFIFHIIYLSGLTYSQPGKRVEGSSSTAWDFLPCVRFLPCSVHQCPDPTSKLSAVM